MSDPFPAIAEASATGETADLFTDIRATVGVRVVNLVWRHLATFDGALPWAWAAVKPLYVSGIADQAAQRFRATMILPTLPSLAGAQPAGVDAVLASYDYSNTVNLFALGALVARLRGDLTPGVAPEGGPRPAPLDLPLPALAAQSDVGPQTWARVLRLNHLADRPEPLILASMYRHLAHWPQFLEKLEQALAPLQADGSLPRAVAANRAAAMAECGLIANAIGTAMPDAVLSLRIERGVAAFVENTIGKMVTICRAIRVARGAR